MPLQIDRGELRRMMDAGAQLVEVLPSKEFEEQHLPGAINIPLGKIDTEAKGQLTSERPVIVYCWDSA